MYTIASGYSSFFFRAQFQKVLSVNMVILGLRIRFSLIRFAERVIK